MSFLKKLFKRSKSLAPTKKDPEPPKKDLIGLIDAYYKKVGVAVVKVKKGPLRVEDRIWIRGYTTDIKQSIQSMQINHKDVKLAKVRTLVGIRVKSRVRRGDKVFRLKAQ